MDRGLSRISCASIAELPGDFRVRLSSIEATEVTRELIAVMADIPEKVAPHLHISLQSGSDRCSAACAAAGAAGDSSIAAGCVQEKLDRPAITTDIIVGFPGETDAEFAGNVDTARAVGFSKIHNFPFSPRRGTPAADMPNQISKQMQQERSRELAAVETELRNEYYKSLIGRQLRVLVETKANSIIADTPQSPLPLPHSLGSAPPAATQPSNCRHLAHHEGHFIDVIARRSLR